MDYKHEIIRGLAKTGPEPCIECGRQTSRHFCQGHYYEFSLCRSCRNGHGGDHEVNLTYMKKACVHFQRLWREVLKKEGIKLKKKQNIPKLHSKDDFFRPVAQYANYFDLYKINDHIKDIWKEKINPLFEMYPSLIKYNPSETFRKCVGWALSKKPLKSVFVKKYTSNGKHWDKYCRTMLWREYYNDFDFCTCDPRIVCRRKAKLYQARESSFAPLQALFRGYMVRKKANDRLRMKSAVEIQKVWRKKRAMLKYIHAKQCAVKIQALCRGYYVRRPYGIYRSWALWNAHTQSIPPELKTIVQNLVSHGAVRRKRKKAFQPTPYRRKKRPHHADNQKTLQWCWGNGRPSL